PHHAHSGNSYPDIARTVRRYRRSATRRFFVMTRPFALGPAWFAPLALASLMALSGCGALVVGGTAATTALVATDRRTAGEQVEDKAIEMKIGNEMRKLVGDNG